MAYTTKNYMTEGGDRWVVGGTLSLPNVTPAKGAKATLAIGTSTSEVTYTAKAIGVAGNSIKIAHVADVEAEAVKVEVDGTTITVRCVVAGGNITTTAAQVEAAITASEAASALVTAAKGSTGAGAVVEKAATPLANGKDTTPAKKGDICFDATNIYIATADIAITDDGTAWKKVALSALE